MSSPGSTSVRAVTGAAAPAREWDPIDEALYRARKRFHEAQSAAWRLLVLDELSRSQGGLSRHAAAAKREAEDELARIAGLTLEVHER